VTHRQFFHLIRQYSSLALRFRRSYADAVAEVYKARQAAVSTAGLTDQETEKLLSQNAAFVQREYGSVDPDFQLPIS